MKVVVFAGGVGGAKLVDGLAQLLAPDELSIIVNTGDDFEYLSLKISPDLDTVCYTLADLANPETGWGQRDETWVTFDAIRNLSGPAWFRLGDKDLATHILRTFMLDSGKTLTEVTQTFCRHWGIEHPVFPMSDDPVRTTIHTTIGEALGFQEYFVHQACEPTVQSIEFRGAEEAMPSNGVLEVIEKSDVVILAPSNPWVSIDPILAISGYKDAISTKTVIAVSPLIGGKALKGPAAKITQEMDITPCAAAVADHYRDFLTGFVFDFHDRGELEKIERWRIIPLVTDIIMKDKPDRVRLAQEVLTFSETVHNRSR
jgi:LPPG:FO 2-phospho-L-lactate transferase